MQDVHANIVAAARNAGRLPDRITLMAVSKTFDAAAVCEAVAGGQRVFGENYLQEALEKMAEVARLLGKTATAAAAATVHSIASGAASAQADGSSLTPLVHIAAPATTETSLAGENTEPVNPAAAPVSVPGDSPTLSWHFIGPIQSNKTGPIAQAFDWVHSVERLKIAQRLSAQRPAGMAPLNVCLQVNISGEASKSGATLQEAPTLAHAIAALPNLRLRGLMAIPEAAQDFEAQRVPFRQLRLLFERLVEEGLMLDCLSMGMSADMDAAIAEGATMVRIGSAIFGRRDVV
ncbi:MAG: YggS family pyridoxal phosphate-dependent enzyme [Janthinobacterium lividum]